MKGAPGPGFILAFLAVLLLATGAALAQSGGYDLTWHTVDGGGYTFSEGDGYTLGSTVGQADAGGMIGNDYTLAGGFWGGGVARYGIYLPLVLKSY